MHFLADLHIHSHYAYATSKYLNLESLYQWALIKGIDVVGTGDFTHPAWFAELQEKLIPDGQGLFKLKNPPLSPALPNVSPKEKEIRFLLSTEVSSIYRKNDRVRKNHNLLYAPDFATVEAINQGLSHYGNLASDGRPILKLSSRDVLEVVRESSASAYLIPAHIWTPWFSTFGSKSGYDSLEACFEDLTEEIFALETGLSSDPAMNWTVSNLDAYTLVSSSDAHSPGNLGREANRFATERSYEGIFTALKTGKGFEGTYEFFPEEGKYHMDGHRKCGVMMEPSDSMSSLGICPVCGKKMTLGVLYRVTELADRQHPRKPADAADFEYIVPLPEILSELLGKGPKTKTVLKEYIQLISTFGNEFTLLHQVPIDQIEQKGKPQLALAINNLRMGSVQKFPGFDGQYGQIHLIKE